jgi:hypothetical protein
MENGTVSRPLLLASATVVPGGAASLKLRVHTVVAPGLISLGVQANEDGIAPGNVVGWGDTRLMVAVFEAPFRLAVKVAV